MLLVCDWALPRAGRWHHQLRPLCLPHKLRGVRGTAELAAESYLWFSSPSNLCCLILLIIFRILFLLRPWVSRLSFEILNPEQRSSLPIIPGSFLICHSCYEMNTAPAPLSHTAINCSQHSLCLGGRSWSTGSSSRSSHSLYYNYLLNGTVIHGHSI